MPAQAAGNGSNLYQQRQNRVESLKLMDYVTSLIPRINPDWQFILQADAHASRLKRARVRVGGSIPLFIVGGFVLMIALILLSLVIDGGGDVGPAIVVMLFLFLLGAGMIVLGIVLIKSSAKRRTQALAKAKELEGQMEESMQRIANVYYDCKLEEYYPFNYFYPEAITAIRENLVDFRADSIKEAINVYEQTQFNQQMLQNHAQMAQMMEYTARQAAAAPDILDKTEAQLSAANFFFG